MERLSTVARARQATSRLACAPVRNGQSIPPGHGVTRLRNPRTELPPVPARRYVSSRKGTTTMKFAAIQKLRRKLAADEAVYGLWVTLESASITEMAVALGLDWVVIDAEHRHLDWADILDHIRATVRRDRVVLARVADPNYGLRKRAGAI